ncbi:MAG: ERF family protein [Fusobacteriaceae bacterium]
MENNKLNLRARLAKARVELQKKNLKMTGENKFSKYKYFQLTDFLAEINEINADLGLLTFFTFDIQEAVLEILDCDSDEKIMFRIPSCSVEMKGAMAIQMLGAQQTYLRRYLFLVAYEISEADLVEQNTEVNSKSNYQQQEQQNTEVNSKSNYQQQEQQKPFDKKACIVAIMKLTGEDTDKLQGQLDYHKIDGLDKATEIQLKTIYKFMKGGYAK